MLHKCFNCQKEFEAPGSNRRFCSKECYNQYQSKKTPVVIYHCENCGQEFRRTLRAAIAAYNKGQTFKYCSPKCHSDAWGKHRIKQTCYVCGKEFLLQQKDAGPFRCCSTACAKHSDHNFHNGGTYIKLHCQYCGSEFHKTLQYVNHEMEKGRYPKFCSRKCSIKAKQQLRPNNQKVQSTCKYCGKEITVLVSDQGKTLGHYCNWDCYKAATEKQWKTYNELRSKLNSTPAYQKWRVTVLARDNYKCVDCGSEEKLHVHHKYPMHRIALDYQLDEQQILQSPIFNDPNNGETVCVSCHYKRHPWEDRLAERDELGRFSRLEMKTTDNTQDNNSGIKLEGTKS